MARYGRDFDAGYPGGGGRDRYDRFRNAPRRGGGRGAGPAMGGWDGPYGWGGYDGGAYGPRGMDRGWNLGRGPGGRGPGVRTDDGRSTGGDGPADRVCAADIMTANPEAVTPDATLSEVATRMRELDVGIIPVVDDMDSYRLRGVITDRDITVRAAAEGKDMGRSKVSDFMTSNVETVSENDHVREVFTVMKRARVRRVPVTDDEGRLTGIVSQADLAVSYAGLDLQRENEVEEVIERISEPARPRWDGRDGGSSARRSYVVGGTSYGRGYPVEELGDRLRDGWNRLRQEARHLMARRYDRGWRP